MKLELKHLASYLHYDLKVLDTSQEDCIFDLNEWLFREKQFVRPFFKNHLEQILNDDSLKPILFPLSSLTKEITINGEKVKIIDKIEILTDKNHFEYILRFLDFDSYEILPYWVMELLFSYKIDVFGLIELGLAEPVTEDFNPYK